MIRPSFSRRVIFASASLIFLGLAFGTTLASEPRAGNQAGAQAIELAMQAKQRRERLRAAIAVHQRHGQRLMGISDVVGSGIGLGPDGQPIIKVFTARHGVRGIPDVLEGVLVRTEVSGRFYALRGETCDATGDGLCTTAERWPLPVPTGVSVGHPAITAGTIAARVTNGTNVFVLSNNHVLANTNQAAIGDPILQPGSFDGGTNPDDSIATLATFEPIKFCTVWFIWLICEETNTIDAAIALTDPTKLGVATPLGEFGSVAGYGAPSRILHPAYGNPATLGDEDLAQLFGIELQKYGRTTGVTVGTVNTIGATVDVCYDQSCTNVARFTDQLIVTPGTFIAGGDSGSLAITHNTLKQPVGLLFAGSTTQAIANRIDLVLTRFGVTVDEGVVILPTIDVAVTGIDVPTPVRVGEPVEVTVTVENRGQQPIANMDVTLRDDGVTVGMNPVTDLAPGASATVSFFWTPTTGGLHTLEASHQLAGDENPANDTHRTDVNVLLAASGPQLQLRQVQAHTDRWTTVELDYEYGDEMVVVCSPNYDLSATGPALVRVRNARGASFEVGLGRPWFGGFEFEHFSATVHCMIVRQGVYTVAEDGVKMEAVKLAGFTSVDHAGSWFGQLQDYQNPEGYSRPVVVGQVVSPDTGIPPSYCPDPLNICEQDWSVFWSRGAAVSSPPSSSTLYVGRHTGEDPSGRAAETLMYVVIEAGTGTIEGRRYLAGLGADTVRGMENRPPYTYNLSGLASASAAIVSQAAMDGADGGWALLYGPSAVSPTRLRLAIDEDWYFVSERRHTTEQVAYIVFE